jgi:hypothetical protein
MLTQTMDLATVVRLAANRLFFFGAHAPGGQEVTHNYVSVDVANLLGLADVTGYDQELDIIQYLGLTDRYFADPLFNSLRLRQGEVLSQVFTEVCGNVFNWTPHDAPLYEALKRAYICGNVLGLVDVTVAVQEVDVFNEFSWTEIVDSAATIYERATTHSVIKQHLTFSISGGPACDREKEYSPFVGEGGDGSFPVVDETPPTLSTGTLQLIYTIASPFQVHSVLLQNPEHGNEDTLTFAKIDRKTLGGTRKIYSDLNWGETQSFRLSIKDMNATDNVCGLTVDTLLDFLNLSLGKVIELVDWEGRTWDGVIVTEETDISNTTRDGVSFDIIFEGVLA